jgi:hypothetical protein
MCLGDMSVRSLAARFQGVRPRSSGMTLYDCSMTVLVRMRN